MIQHRNCLYCGKLLGIISCDCAQSKLKVLTNSPMLEQFIKPIYLQDLVSLAKMLPKINFLDHESEIIRRYSIGQWVEVDKYVMFVYELHERLAKIRHTAVIADRRATFVDRVVQCVTRWYKSLITAINRLIDKQEMWLWSESPGMRVKVYRNRLQRWFLPKECATLSECIKSYKRNKK